MTRDELRKKVAMKIAYHTGYTWGSSAVDHDALREAADAAIAIVLEEAARVAEEASFQFINTPTQVEIVDVRHTIAAAIRALSK